MAFISVHGLGQDASSWNGVKECLDLKVTTVNLFELLHGKEYKYQDLYGAFCDYLNRFDEKLYLCGLSLGGILALEYTKHHPDKVKSLILIGTPYRIPKILYALQVMIFHLLPKDSFKELGISKKNFIELAKSMTTVNIRAGLDKVKCQTLLLCGSKDKTNKKSLEPLHKAIKTSEVAIVDGAGHAVNEDEPSELAKIISSKWQSCGSK